MKKLLFLLIGILLYSCNAVQVNYDYDKAADFSAYTTYNYFSDIETGLSEFDERRIIAALDITLQRKGLLFSEEPDIFINIMSTVFPQQAGNSVGVGLGSGGGNVGGGVSVGIPVSRPQLMREIQIDLVDATRDLLLWQAVSQSPFREADTPAVKDEKMQELVTKIFDKYPPKKRK
jgi:hypothetical protein